MLEAQQMVSTGDDVVRLGFHGASEKLVVSGIFSELVGFVKVPRNDGFSENEPEKTSYSLVVRADLLPDFWVAEHPADLSHYFQRGGQLYFLIDPEILEGGGGSVFSENTAHKQVGVNYRPYFSAQRLLSLFFPPL